MFSFWADIVYHTIVSTYGSGEIDRVLMVYSPRWRDLDFTRFVYFVSIHDIHDVIFYTEASEITGTSGKIAKELVANFATTSSYFLVLPYKR